MSNIWDRERLLRSTVLAGFAAAGLAISPAYAQDNDDEDAQAEDRIVVTGSRIQRAGIDTVYPAISVDAQVLEDRAFTNLADALNEVPTFGNPDATPQGAQNTFSVGQNFVDFLGLGSQRTLTVVNGRRFVSSNTPVIFGETGGLQVDFNVLPIALIDRIETISVGGAPIYGSDAIAGTINVITRDDYEGFEIGGQYGVTAEGDAEESQFTVVAGANFDGGRGNVALSMEFFNQKELLRFARPWRTENNPGMVTVSAGSALLGGGQNANFIARNQRLNLFVNGGLIAPGNFTIPSFGIGAMSDGNFYQFDGSGQLVNYTPGTHLGGSAFFTYGGDGPDFFDQVSQIQSPLERFVLSGQAHYDITNNIRFSTDFQFANTSADELVNQGGFQTWPFGGTSSGLTIQSDNPLLTTQAQGVLAGLGVAQFGLHRFNNDIIDSMNSNEVHLWRATAGLQGDFELGGRAFGWDVSVVHGESDAESRREMIIDGRFINAIDAIRLTAADLAAINPDATAAENAILAVSGTANAGVGDIVCRAAYQQAAGTLPAGPNSPPSGSGVTDTDLIFVSGCIPLDIFGENRASQEALDWVTGLAFGVTDIEQTIYTANFNGELFDLPAGPFSFNIGYEAREERANFLVDAASQVALGRSSPIPSTGGRYTTSEQYVELLIPVVSEDMDIPFLQFAEIQAAYRDIDNSQAGPGETWTVGGRFSIIPDVMFRANYTESLRAPSLVELFTPITQTFSFASDPCDFRFAAGGNNPAVRQANCAADIGAGYDPTTFTSNIVNATGRGRTGGNPNLTNETSEAYAVGMTIEPERFIENLLISVDYTNLELSNAIGSISLTNLLQACYDSASFPNNAACAAFTRDATGQIVDFQTGQGNFDSLDYEGLDLLVNYNFDVANALGRLPFGLVNSDSDLGGLEITARLNKRINRGTVLAGAPQGNTIGGFSDPEYAGTFDFAWTKDNTRVFWRTVWQDESLVTADANSTQQYFDLDAVVASGGGYTLADLNAARINTTEARFIHNMSVSHIFTDAFPGLGTDTFVQFNINNVFDHRPGVIQQSLGHFGFDELLGRRYTIRLRTVY